MKNIVITVVFKCKDCGCTFSKKISSKSEDLKCIKCGSKRVEGLYEPTK